MSLDGIFLKYTVEELSEKLLNLRTDKIYQPSKNEILISFKGIKESYSLVASCSASNARIHITNNKYENPRQAPMFCMLLRKKLMRSKLIDIKQRNLERAISLNFNAINELGDNVNISLIVEIMGKHSNIILVENKKIIDSIKRVDSNISSKRLVLPKQEYIEPPSQDKLLPTATNNEQIFNKIAQDEKEETLDKKILKHIKGISPIIAKEIAYLSQYNQNEKLKKQIENLCEHINKKPKFAYVLLDSKGNAIDLSFIKISHLKNSTNIKAFESFSSAIEFYYLEKAKNERLQSKSQNIEKTITSHIEKLNKKIEIQTKELAKSKTREELRIKADVIEANINRIQKGFNEVILQNFYDNMKPIKIKLDPAKTASQNAQKYYKDYRKSKNSEKFLKIQIEKAKLEVEYLESVLDLLKRVDNEKEVEQIKYELLQEGYIRSCEKKSANHKQEKLKLYELTIDENFKLIIGKNNKQNDEISLKIANKNDMWFHVKNMPGSHVVLITNGRIVPEETLVKAAAIAAFNSSAKEASKVEVDYTKIKYVKKPKGAKPGKVIYTDYKTICVSPLRI